MSKNTKNPQLDQSPEPAPILEKHEIRIFPDGTEEPICIVERSIDPKNPKKTIKHYTESEGTCVNKFNLHEEKVRVRPGYDGGYVKSKDPEAPNMLFCDECLKHNEDLIKSKAGWRLRFFYKPDTYEPVP